MLKCCLLAHGKAETEALTHCGVRVGGIQRGPSKAGGLWRSLVMLEGNPLEQLLTQSQTAWSRPAYGVSQVVVHLWMSITFSVRTRLCRKSQRWNLCPDFHAGPRACRSQRAWFRFFSRALAAILPNYDKCSPHHQTYLTETLGLFYLLHQIVLPSWPQLFST